MGAEIGGRDRGEGALPLVGIMLLVSLLVVSLLLAQPGGRLVEAMKYAVCVVLEAGGAAKDCKPAGEGEPGDLAQDPDLPTHPCLAHSETHYLEETITIPTKRVDARTSSRGTLQLNKRVNPDGTVSWEVVDFTWGEGGVGAGVESGGELTFKFGLWGGAQVTNGNVYSFDNEADARRFYDELNEHRMGNSVKFTVRTNPLTGGFVWLGGKLPWVGDDFDRWMGGSEPDQEPSASYTEGGLTGGFRGEGGTDLLKVPFKGRGWLVVGSRTDHATGQTTHYYARRGEAEVAVQIDLGGIWNRLPAGTRQRASEGVAEALEAAMGLIEERLRGEFGDDFRLDPGHRSQIKTAIRLNPSGGLNYKHRGGTQWGVTYDKDGNLVGMTQTENGQDIVYFRADGKAGADNGGDKAELTAGGQWILFGRRTLTDKTLDYTDPEDRAAMEDFFLYGDEGALDDYFEGGGGTMSRVVFDNEGDTSKLEGKGDFEGRRRDWGGVFELGEEWETHRLRSAEYYKLGTGWVDWAACR